MPSVSEITILCNNANTIVRKRCGTTKKWGIICGKCGQEDTVTTNTLFRNNGVCSKACVDNKPKPQKLLKNEDDTIQEHYEKLAIEHGAVLLRMETNKNNYTFFYECCECEKEASGVRSTVFTRNWCCRECHMKHPNKHNAERVRQNGRFQCLYCKDGIDVRGTCVICTNNMEKIEDLYDASHRIGSTITQIDHKPGKPVYKAYFNCCDCKDDISKTVQHYTKDTEAMFFMCKICYKKTENDVVAKLEEKGFKLLEPYQGTNVSVNMICGKCNNEGMLRPHDIFARDGGCNGCKGQRIKETVQERYGEEYINIAKVPEIRVKISEKIIAAIAANPDILIARKNTNMKKYGVVAAFLLPQHNEKKEKALMKKYGTLYPLQLQEIHDKIKAKNLEVLGFEYPLQSIEVRDKIKNLNIKKYGVPYVFQVPEILEKALKAAIKANMKKYGVPYALMNKEVLHRVMASCNRIREYKWESGKISLVQGYERFLLRDLENKGIDYSNVFTTKDVPTISYTLNDRPHVYHPDALVKTKNSKYHLFEIKSIWTFFIDAEKNYAKWMAAHRHCKQTNGTFHIIFYNVKGERILKTTGWTDTRKISVCTEGKITAID